MGIVYSQSIPNKILIRHCPSQNLSDLHTSALPFGYRQNSVFDGQSA